MGEGVLFRMRQRTLQAQQDRQGLVGLGGCDEIQIVDLVAVAFQIALDGFEHRLPMRMICQHLKQLSRRRRRDLRQQRVGCADLPGDSL
jgi:hypothetical protein